MKNLTKWFNSWRIAILCGVVLFAVYAAWNKWEAWQSVSQLGG